MKKILVLGMLSLSLALFTERQASAWVNWKFGAGVNWSWQSGGNNVLWGLFRNGQPPGPEVGYPGQHPGYPHGNPATFPYPPPQYGPQNFQFFGGTQPNNGSDAPATVPAAQNNQVSRYNNNSIYQAVGYSPGGNYYPNTYYPTQSYYGNYAPYQAPSYWYGR